jgi:hypothetical protein
MNYEASLTSQYQYELLNAQGPSCFEQAKNSTNVGSRQGLLRTLGYFRRAQSESATFYLNLISLTNLVQLVSL